jgi:hypothetical protein
MISPAPPSRLPVPITRPRLLPAVVPPRNLQADKHRDASDAYAVADGRMPRRRGPRGANVDMVV